MRVLLADGARRHGERARDRERDRRAAGARRDSRRRSARADARGPAAAVPGHDAPVRPQARRRGPAGARCRCRCSASIACTSNGEDLIDRPLAERLERLAGVVPRGAERAAARHERRAAAQAFLDAALGARPRGHHGEGRREPLRSGQPRRGVAEDQGRAHARSRRARGRVGQRPAARLAQQSASRRARSRRRLRHARQDVQGPDGRAARVADGEAARRSRSIPTARGYVVEVRPELVVEIAFNELQASRRYPGGLALRFARVVRYRPDKRPEDADTIDTVRAIAAAQGASVESDCGVSNSYLAILISSQKGQYREGIARLRRHGPCTAERVHARTAQSPGGRP